MSPMPVALPLAALAFTMLWSAPLRADTVIAFCTASGCTCDLSPASAEDLMLMLGDGGELAPPQDPTRATLVYDSPARRVYWTDRPRAEVVRAYGGEGDCPITLFPEEVMIPLDGTWQWTTLGETAVGCPPMMAQMLAASRAETMTTRVDWNGAFHPDRLAQSLPAPEMAGTSAYEWRATGPAGFLSDNIRGRSCEEGSCSSVAVVLSMSLVAPDRITGVLNLRSRVEAPGGAAAVLAGYGMLDCRVRVQYDIHRTGP